MKFPLAYPCRLERDGENEWAIVFPDVPEAVFGASSPEAAWDGAVDILALALCSYPERGLPFPTPRPVKRGNRLVVIPAVMAAKLFIRQAMSDKRMNVADLARLLKTDHKSARRVISLSHNTRMDQLEAILGALGVRVALMAA